MHQCLVIDIMFSCIEDSIQTFFIHVLGKPIINFPDKIAIGEDEILINFNYHVSADLV